MALRERLDRVRAGRGVDIVRRLGRLTVEYTGLPVHDSRTPDEILGYDEAGLPS